MTRSPEVGDRISVKYHDGEIQGIFLTEDQDFLFLKLDSGYNTGISKKRIEATKVLQGKKEEIENNEKVVVDRGKGISVLSTGGTISSRVDYATGGVKPSRKMDSLYSEEMSKVHDISVHFKVVSSILSENMSPDMWVSVAGEVRNALDRDKGVVVFHGTDTMSYTASAIAFMLEEQTGTVVFTGAQRSPDRPSSDSYVNIEGSIKFASIQSGEVGICMHSGLSDDSVNLLRAVRSRKMHSSRRDAFKSMEYPEIGLISSGKQVYFRQERKASERNVVRNRLEPAVGLIFFNPTLSPEDVDQFAENRKCIVIMGTGLGHVAQRLIPTLREIIRGGTRVVMSTQCISGIVDMNVYSTGRDLLDAGVLHFGNILPEVAYVKAMYVLANYPDDEFEIRMAENMRGEILGRNHEVGNLE
ncbi:MAG: Glu-tRNA(Gln) amidotransferase subunit GatD [Candidatus Thermoplasmatota archaeon]|jgi:glutamyl-tRNA(Gln) amidotransferase subunit D|nr:Glu-tRNA(Gln) amidotransferase subunit GatD [Candidatus Thermoplasmatota archaeon]